MPWVMLGPGVILVPSSGWALDHQALLFAIVEAIGDSWAPHGYGVSGIG